MSATNHLYSVEAAVRLGVIMFPATLAQLEQFTSRYTWYTIRSGVALPFNRKSVDLLLEAAMETYQCKEYPRSIKYEAYTFACHIINVSEYFRQVAIDKERLGRRHANSMSEVDPFAAFRLEILAQPTVLPNYSELLEKMRGWEKRQKAEREASQIEAERRPEMEALRLQADRITAKAQASKAAFAAAHLKITKPAKAAARPKVSIRREPSVHKTSPRKTTTTSPPLLSAPQHTNSRERSDSVSSTSTAVADVGDNYVPTYKARLNEYVYNYWASPPSTDAPSLIPQVVQKGFHAPTPMRLCSLQSPLLNYDDTFASSPLEKTKEKSAKVQVTAARPPPTRSRSPMPFPRLPSILRSSAEDIRKAFEEMEARWKGTLPKATSPLSALIPDAVLVSDKPSDAVKHEPAPKLAQVPTCYSPLTRSDSTTATIGLVPHVTTRPSITVQADHNINVSTTLLSFNPAPVALCTSKDLPKIPRPKGARKPVPKLTTMLAPSQPLKYMCTSKALPALPVETEPKLRKTVSFEDERPAPDPELTPQYLLSQIRSNQARLEDVEARVRWVECKVKHINRKVNNNITHLKVIGACVEAH